MVNLCPLFGIGIGGVWNVVAVDLRGSCRRRDVTVTATRRSQHSPNPTRLEMESTGLRVALIINSSRLNAGKHRDNHARHSQTNPTANHFPHQHNYRRELFSETNSIIPTICLLHFHSHPNFHLGSPNQPGRRRRAVQELEFEVWDLLCWI